MAFPAAQCRSDTFVPVPRLYPSGLHLRQEGHTRLHLIPVRLQSQNLPEAVLACKAIGIDPSDIGGYDLGKPLDDFEAVTAQGLNGAVYALLALNADRLEIDGELEQKYLTYIVKQEKPSGGFSLDDSSDTADVDLTAMTLQCLEPCIFRNSRPLLLPRSVPVRSPSTHRRGNQRNDDRKIDVSGI